MRLKYLHCSFITIVALAAVICVSCSSFGVKKKSPVVAIGDRHLWLEPVNTQIGFDKASRAAILLYALRLQEETRTLSNQKMAERSINKWLDKELTLSVRNYQLAAKNCTTADWTCVGNVSNSEELLAKASTVTIPANLLPWKANIGKFVKDYISEQSRLAELFPKTSSEIDLFNPNEWNGDKLGDRKFFLTFDDGPTSVAGNTDGVLEMLAANKKTAVFFVLGGNFENRLNETNAVTLAGIYQEQCVGLHGWEHQSHETWTKWKDGRTWQTSVTDTEALLKTTFANTPGFLPLFRPPYGQRKADSGAFFQEHGLQVALWNLDSQDWNIQVDADDIINRMLTLMLIRRHGVLLFHDVHPKAKEAVPVIIEELGNAVEWGDCHQIGESL